MERRNGGAAAPGTSRQRHRRKTADDDNDDGNGERSKQDQEAYLPLGYEPQLDDILCGKTKEAFNHDGNQMFRITIGKYVQHYASISSRSGRGQFISQLLDKIHSEGARFLKRKGNRWVVLNPKHAREKVGHALRDTAWQMGKSLTSPLPSPVPVQTNHLREALSHRVATDEIISDRRPLPFQDLSGQADHQLLIPLAPEPPGSFMNLNHPMGFAPSFCTSANSMLPLVASSLDQHQHHQQQPISLVAALAPQPLNHFSQDDFNSRSSISTNSSSGSSEDVQIKQVEDSEISKSNESYDFVVAATLQLDEVKNKLRRAREEHAVGSSYNIDEAMEPISIQDRKRPSVDKKAAGDTISGSLELLQTIPTFPGHRSDNCDESDASTIDHINDSDAGSHMGDFTNGMDW